VTSEPVPSGAIVTSAVASFANTTDPGLPSTRSASWCQRSRVGGSHAVTTESISVALPRAWPYIRWRRPAATPETTSPRSASVNQRGHAVMSPTYGQMRSGVASMWRLRTNSIIGESSDRSGPCGDSVEQGRVGLAGQDADQ
jgi:hypothetical protein